MRDFQGALGLRGDHFVISTLQVSHSKIMECAVSVWVGCCQQMAYSECREISLRNKEKLGLSRELNMSLGFRFMIKELQKNDLQLSVLPAANPHCFRETLRLRRLLSHHAIYLSLHLARDFAKHHHFPQNLELQDEQIIFISLVTKTRFD